MGQRLGEVDSHQQRTGQPRAVGYRDRIDILETALRQLQRLVQYRDHGLHVLPRGQLRYHAAVVRVQLDLRANNIRKHVSPVGDNSHSRLVARGLDTENPSTRLRTGVHEK